VLILRVVAVAVSFCVWLFHWYFANWLPVQFPDAEAALPASPPVASQFSFGDKSIDFEQLEVRVGDKRMPLTLMEAALLRYFVQHDGSPVPRKEILEKVWGVHEDTDTRAIDNFIVRLRRYIEAEPSNPRHLQTVRGVGYRFVSKPE
jgi:DNA-binding response OmpR family regulator